MSTRLPARWERASGLPVQTGRGRRPEIVSLPPGLPDLATLFTFMRDAELRFASLRLRIEDRTRGTAGNRTSMVEALIRHPGRARVTTTEPDRTTAANYRTWVSDGTKVRTYSAISRVATERPVRRRVVGLDDVSPGGDPNLPGRSRVYAPVTVLPMESLPEAFVHPAGFCQNVLATGVCRIKGRTTVAHREAIVLECEHPRTTLVHADRPDHTLTIAVDVELGIIARLVETLGDHVARDAEAVTIEPDAPLPDAAFDIAVPADASRIY